MGRQNSIQLQKLTLTNQTSQNSRLNWFSLQLQSARSDDLNTTGIPVPVLAL
jgi:hypothetical protein